MHTQEFWDSNLSVIESGIANEGRLEKYIKAFNEKHLPKVVSSELLDAFFESQSIEEQRKAFNQFPLKELKDLIRQISSTFIRVYITYNTSLL